MVEQGWGVDVNEDALKKYPPVNDPKTGMWSAMEQNETPTASPTAGVGNSYSQIQRGSRL